MKKEFADLRGGKKNCLPTWEMLFSSLLICFVQRFPSCYMSLSLKHLISAAER